MPADSVGARVDNLRWVHTPGLRVGPRGAGYRASVTTDVLRVASGGAELDTLPCQFSNHASESALCGLCDGARHVLECQARQRVNDRAFTLAGDRGVWWSG